MSLSVKNSCGGKSLPELTSPATASDIVSGKEAIDGAGNLMTGTYLPPIVTSDTPNSAQEFPNFDVYEYYQHVTNGEYNNCLFFTENTDINTDTVVMFLLNGMNVVFMRTGNNIYIGEDSAIQVGAKISSHYPLVAGEYKIIIW